MTPKLANIAGILSTSDSALAPIIELGLRERKKRATRERIVDVAFELFSTRGYEATTLQQIAERSEVAPRTIGNYFAQKVDLLVAYRETMLAAAEAAAARTEGRPGFDRVREALLAAARENERHPNGRLAQALIAAHASYRALAQVQERFRALLGGLLAEEVAGDAERDLAVLALVAAYTALQQRWARSTRRALVPDVDRLLRQWAFGVLTAPR